MATQGNDRREFLKLGGTALAATAVSWNARSYASIVGANDRVKVGIIGFGDRMKGGDIPAFQQHAGFGRHGDAHQGQGSDSAVA